MIFRVLLSAAYSENFIFSLPRLWTYTPLEKPGFHSPIYALLLSHLQLKSHHQYYSNCNKIHTHAFPPEQSFLIVNVEYRLLNLQEKSNLFVLNEWSYPDWMTTINALQVYITVPCIHSAPLSLASVKQLHAVLTWAVGIKKSTRRSTPETTDSCFMISEHACNQEEKLFCHGVIREMLMWNRENVSKI